MEKARTRFLSTMLIIILVALVICIFNKTCFRRNYEVTHDKTDVEIAVPFFSYFLKSGEEDNKYTVKMASFRQREVVQEEINDYLKTLDILECKNAYYDNVSDISISKYEITSEGIWFLNTINLEYTLGNICEEAINEK